MDHTDDQLLVNLEQGVLWLTLNQPDKKNALTHAMYTALREALDDAQHDERVGCIVITGAGDSFCAGGDVRRMNAQSTQTTSEKIQSMRERTRVIESLHALSKPSIAMMRGFAVGSGLSLALACDLRYGDPSVIMRTGFLKMGISGDYGVHHFLPRIVGPAKARGLLMLSPKVNAQSALSMGLLHGLHSAHELYSEVQKLASELAGGPQPAICLMKANMNDGLELSLSDLLDLECSRHVECVGSADHREAVLAFREKRLPLYGDRITSASQTR